MIFVKSPNLKTKGNTRLVAFPLSAMQLLVRWTTMESTVSLIFTVHFIKVLNRNKNEGKEDKFKDKYIKAHV